MYYRMTVTAATEEQSFDDMSAMSSKLAALKNVAIEIGGELDADARNHKIYQV